LFTDRIKPIHGRGIWRFAFWKSIFVLRRGEIFLAGTDEGELVGPIRVIRSKKAAFIFLKNNLQPNRGFFYNRRVRGKERPMRQRQTSKNAVAEAGCWLGGSAARRL
jgi:hypothetical protein